MHKATRSARLARSAIRLRRLTGAPLLSTLFTGLTNLALPLSVQVAAGASATGALTLALTPLTMGLAIQRGVLSQIFLRGIATAPKLILVLTSINAGATAASFAIVALATLSPTYLLLSALTPIALTQDAFRFRALGAGRAHRAAVSDFLWFIIFIGGTGGALLTGRSSASWTLITYALGALVACAYGLLRWPTERDIGKSHPSIGSLVLEGTLVAGIGTIAQPILALTSGLDALGVFRIAQVTGTIPGLLMSTLQGALLRGTPLDQASAVRRVAWRVAGAVSLTGIAIVATLMLTPPDMLDDLGFSDKVQLIVTVALVQAGIVVSSWVMVAMWRIRIIARASSWLSVRAVSSLAELLVASLGGYWFGPAGVAAGSLFNNAAVAAYAYRALDRDDRSTASA